MKKLKDFVDVHQSFTFEERNLEKHRDGYGCGQFSLKYLMMTSKIIEVVQDESKVSGYLNKSELSLRDSGLDLNSCLQFLLDLYSQWMKVEVSGVKVSK